MFEIEQQLIEEKIKTYCAANSINLAPLKWSAIPFEGEWGTSTSFFQTAADEARAGSGKKIPVPQRAHEIALQVARALAAGPRHALAAAKEAIRAGLRTPGPDGIAAERALFLTLFGTPDQREGMRAFLEKRDPVFGV